MSKVLTQTVIMDKKFICQSAEEISMPSSLFNSQMRLLIVPMFNVNDSYYLNDSS